MMAAFFRVRWGSSEGASVVGYLSYGEAHAAYQALHARGGALWLALEQWSEPDWAALALYPARNPSAPA